MKKSELKAIITEMAEEIEVLRAERETVTITFPPMTYPPATYSPPVVYEYHDKNWWDGPAIWWSTCDVPVSGSQG